MKHIVIIGAGPAGLTAAYELLARHPEEYRVTVLEESGAIGGISRTVYHNGNRMDLGGHRFFSRNEEIVNWWESILPLQGAPAADDRLLGRSSTLSPSGPDPDEQDRVMLLRRRVSRIYYRRHFFDYPITMKWQTLRNMGPVQTVKAGCSYLKASVLPKPETSLESFYQNRFGTVLYRMFFEGYTEKLWGRHPRDISADWGAQRVKGLSVRALLADMLRKASGRKDASHTETSLIEEFRYPKLGPGQLWETAAAKAEQMGAVICRHHRVRQLACQDGRIQSVICDTPEGEQQISGDIFLSTMPLKDLVAGIRGMTVPDEITHIAAGLPYRDFVTVGLLVDRLELKNETDIPTRNGIVPDCWIYVQDPGVKLGRIQIFNNWSPYMVQKPTETVWIGLEYFCREGDALWNLSEQECAAYAEQELIAMGVLRPGAVRDFHRERVKKAYPAYFDTYAEIDALIAWLDTIPNLYCIGRNGQHRYNNMDHSMLTAMRAVDCITGQQTDRSTVWHVNTEQTYHEEKAE